ncbi:MAG: tetratricopeptide repeat protein, partial [Prochloraceae cyanobacterium]|nr:tetratricopeptide repeat protein [Prochloraceae cyanobacterium]
MAGKPVKLFISYSHRDETLRQQLDKHLAPLKGQKVIEAWHDRQIQAGMNWADEIDDNLNQADIILLLVSPDFVASDYCSNIELKRAMKRHENGEAIVVPVILEPCDWSWLPFSKFQAFPKDAKAIATWENKNEAFLDVAAGIRKVAQDLFEQRQQKLQQKKADREEYKAKVEEALSLSTGGKISIADQDTLDELREKLGLTKEESDRIIDHAYQPFKDKQQKLERYKKTLLKYIENGDYPFSDDIKRQLEIRQRDLGIKTEDLEKVMQPILAQAEVEYQEKLQVAAAAESQRQLELKAEAQKQLEHQRQLELEAETQKQLERQRQDAESHNNLGKVYLEQGKLEEALAAFERAIELDPQNAESHNNLGKVYLEQGKLEEAVAAFEQALELDSQNAQSHNGLGDVYVMQVKLEEAVAAFERAIELDSQDADPHNGLGFVYSEQGKLEEAVAAFERAIELDSQDAYPHNGLGIVYSQQGKLEEAVAAFERAIELDSQNALFHNGLGIVYSQQGKLEEAVAAFERAIELDSQNALF